MCKAGTAMAGTKRDGRLFSVGSNKFVGERRTKKGRFETRRFRGSVKVVVSEWAEWRMA